MHVNNAIDSQHVKMLFTTIEFHLVLIISSDISNCFESNFDNQYAENDITTLHKTHVVSWCKHFALRGVINIWYHLEEQKTVEIADKFTSNTLCPLQSMFRLKRWTKGLRLPSR